jgi:hypothetical protein
MKGSLLIILIFVISLTSCDEFNSETEGDLLFKIRDDLEYSYDDIKLYDSSTHILYFRTNHPEFENCNQSSFSFYVGEDKIYQGSFWPSYLCSFPTGIFISTMPFFYPDYTLRIEYAGGNEPDSRNHPRIIHALKKHDLLHSGLSVAINSIEINGSQLDFSFTVTNRDQTDLLILDIDKMDPGLFHYFTNGLVIYNLNNTLVFKNTIEHQTPSHSNTWWIDWLSVLNSGKSKLFKILYPIDEAISPGNYHASFAFPGLYHVGIDQLFQDNGRIWLGDVLV